MNSPPTIYLILGYPGSGKYTVACELVRQLEELNRPARLIDNHYVNNPIFNLMGVDGRTKLPAGIWPLIHQFRSLLLETIETYSPPELSFVLTNWIAATEQEAPAYWERLQQIAASRESRLVSVVLRCDPKELAVRVPNEDRRRRMKWIDPDAVVELTETVELWDPGPPSATIDNTDLSPADCVARILEL